MTSCALPRGRRTVHIHRLRLSPQDKQVYRAPSCQPHPPLSQQPRVCPLVAGRQICGTKTMQRKVRMDFITRFSGNFFFKVVFMRKMSLLSIGGGCIVMCAPKGPFKELYPPDLTSEQGRLGSQIHLVFHCVKSV